MSAPKNKTKSVLLDANLITPDLLGIPERQVNTGFILSIIGAAVIAFTAMQYNNGLTSITEAEQTLAQIPTTSVADLEFIKDYQAAKALLETNTAELEGLVEALPAARDFTGLLSSAVEPLPGVGGSYPLVVLTGINASITPPKDLGPYGLKPSEANRVLLSIELIGQADNSFVIPDALRTYQHNPIYATYFGGTSIKDDAYTFNLNLLRITPKAVDAETQVVGEGAL